jgi:hypothetical protein
MSERAGCGLRAGSEDRTTRRRGRGILAMIAEGSREGQKSYLGLLIRRGTPVVGEIPVTYGSCCASWSFSSSSSAQPCPSPTAHPPGACRGWGGVRCGCSLGTHGVVLRLRSPMSEQCVFCPNPAVSTEHLFASQFVKILKADPRGLPRSLTMFISENWDGPVIETRKPERGRDRTKLTIEHTVRLCKRCNNGWMNRIDVDAKPYLAEMIAGRPIKLDSQAQATLATWIAKVAVASRSTHYRFGEDTVPLSLAKSWTDWLYTRQSIPPAWLVCLFRYDGSEPFTFTCKDVRVDVDAPGFASHGIYACVIAGYFGIKLLGIDGSPTRPDWGHSLDAYGLVPIWPKCFQKVTWPPSLTLHDEDLDTLMEDGINPPSI